MERHYVDFLTFNIFQISKFDAFGSLNLILKQARIIPYGYGKVGSYLVVAQYPSVA